MSDVTDWGVDQDTFDTGPTAEQLTAVINLAEQQYILEEQAAYFQAELDRTTAQLRAVQEKDLPEAMSLAGLDSYTLKGGRKVSVDTKIVASPTKDQQPEMLAWLERHGHDDLIKHEIKVGFGKGEDARADMLMDWVDQNLPKQKTDDKRFVHPQTLSAFVREQLGLQVDLPDAFGVVIIKKATIKRPKVVANGL